MKNVILLALSLALAVAGTLVLTGCSSLEAITPATQADLQQQLADAQEYQNRALEEAADGDWITAGILYLLSTVTGAGAAVGLSRNRRKNQAIGADAIAALTGVKQTLARPELPKDA